jgi:hypothetical protein
MIKNNQVKFGIFTQKISPVKYLSMGGMLDFDCLLAEILQYDQ